MRWLHAGNLASRHQRATIPLVGVAPHASAQQKNGIETELARTGSREAYHKRLRRIITRTLWSMIMFASWWERPPMYQLRTKKKGASCCERPHMQQLRTKKNTKNHQLELAVIVQCGKLPLLCPFIRRGELRDLHTML